MVKEIKLPPPWVTYYRELVDDKRGFLRCRKWLTL